MYREEQNSHLIFGVRPLEEALDSGASFVKVYVQKGMGDGLRHIKQILNRHKVNFTEVPKEKLDTLSKFKNHQGVVARISAIEYHNAEDLVNNLIEEEKTPFVIALDRVTDVRNFGAIARTAMAAGLDAIIIPEKGSATVTDEAIKASAGALMHLPVCRSSNLFQTIKHLKEAGLQVICGTEKANKELFFDTYTKPCVLIVGSEEDGIHPSLLKLADKLVKIPMNSQLDSLNVSVAAGIMMYEVIRQNS
ncbi:MAG: rRNA ((2251)-2-O)-methyltransferase RlmB [Bacteroidota bacterium]|jgi:23S rRNA (guanosine2251-2'-O)-methyltransferase